MSATSGCAQLRGNRHLDDLPGADVEPQPGLHDRRADLRGADPAPEAQPRRRDEARLRAARGGADPRPRGAAAAVSAPALGRPAPAGDDRDGARQPARRADRRRADHRARRDGAGADPAPDRRPEGALRHGRAADHPRPDGGAAVRRPRLRHAARRGARVGADRGDLHGAAASLHQAAARLGAEGRGQPLRGGRRDRAQGRRRPRHLHAAPGRGLPRHQLRPAARSTGCRSTSSAARRSGIVGESRVGQDHLRHGADADRQADQRPRGLPRRGHREATAASRCSTCARGCRSCSRTPSPRSTRACRCAS